MSVSGYLCRSNPYQCIASCNSSGIPDSGKLSCFVACVDGTTDSGNCPYVVVPDGGSFVDTVYIQVPSDSCDLSADFYRDVEQSFLAFMPVFIAMFGVYVVVRIFGFVMR